MPEGHTLHRVARDQQRDLRGQVARVSSPQGRFAASAARLDGRAVTKVDAYGKHLFTWFEGNDVLHVHLGLIGKYRRRPSPPPPPVGLVRLRIESPLATWDLSGPNVCAVIAPPDVDAVTRTLGPDPLRRGAKPDRFIERVQRSSRPIGALLLEQDVIAGIGNVFRAELLHVHGIHPATPGNALSREQLQSMWDTISRWLRDGVRRNRIVTRTVRDPLFVYHQETCATCGALLTPLDIGGRRIDVCLVCQPAPR